MNMSHYANRLAERNRVFEDLEWEVEERRSFRRSQHPSEGRSINLSAEVDRYLGSLAS